MISVEEVKQVLIKEKVWNLGFIREKISLMRASGAVKARLEQESLRLLSVAIFVAGLGRNLMTQEREHLANGLLGEVL